MESITTALGFGSGIDMAELTRSLVEAQFAARTARLDRQQETLDAQITAASTLRGQIQSLASALGDRVRNGDLAPQPVSSNAAVVTATATAGIARSGSYGIEVRDIARGQNLASTAFADRNAALGGGTLTFRFGAMDGTSFTADANATDFSVEIESGASLAEIAASVNGRSGPVTASVIRTTSGDQLVFKGATGLQRGFVVDVTELAGETGLSQLAYAPGSSSATLLQESNDASFFIDGLEVTRASNSITDVVDGVTIQLNSAAAGSVQTLRIDPPTSALTTAITDLVGAFNEVQTTLAELTDPVSGEISRDDGARALRRQLGNLTTLTIMPNAAEGEPSTLAELGIRTNRDGSFSVDPAALQRVLNENPEAVAAMFTPGLFGVFAEVDRIARQTASIASPGSLASSIDRYTKLSAKLATDRAALTEDSERLSDRLSRQFAGLDARVNAFNSTRTFLEQQIDAWNSANRR